MGRGGAGRGWAERPGARDSAPPPAAPRGRARARAAAVEPPGLAARRARPPAHSGRETPTPRPAPPLSGWWCAGSPAPPGFGGENGGFRQREISSPCLALFRGLSSHSCWLKQKTKLLNHQFQSGCGPTNISRTCVELPRAHTGMTAPSARTAL